MSVLSPLPPTDSATAPPEATRVPDERQAPPRRAAAWKGRGPGGNVVAYLLILFGTLFLIATFVPLGGGVFLLGIGLAFVVARLATGRYGYAVPAGLLVGLGAYVSLQDAGILSANEGGWPLIFLGLGFLAIYPLGGSPRRAWPLVAGALLIALGLAQIGLIALAPLAAYTRAASLWPIALVMLGLWILGRDALPSPARQVAGAILLAALIVGGALALAAAIAASSGPAVGTLGAPPPLLGQTTTLTAPIAAGQTLRVANQAGGSTRVIAGDAGQVRARVTRAPGFGPPAVVGFAPSASGVTLEARSAGAWPNPSPSVSLVVEAPRDAPLVVESSSGDVAVDDRAASVEARVSSGNLTVSRVDGPANLQSSSGSIRATDVIGPFSALASSGSIDATGIRHPASVQTSSGSIRLSGTFVDAVRVHASSGSIELGLAPDSSTRIAVTTSSGSISTGALTLANVNQSPHQLVGTLGSGSGLLTVETSSGSVRLDAAR